MGFFKKEIELIKDTAPKFITDPNQLFATFEAVQLRKKQATNESLGLIGGTFELLMGDKTKIGQFDAIRKKIQSTYGMTRMEIGMDMITCMNNAENFITWNSQYSQYLEEIMDAYEHVGKSALGIIKRAYDELDAKDATIVQLKNELEASKYAMPGQQERPSQQNPSVTPSTSATQQDQLPEYFPMSEQEKIAFRALVTKKFQRYKECKLAGDKQMINIARQHAMNLATKYHQEKIAIVQELLRKVEEEIVAEKLAQTDLTKKNLSPSSQNTILSPNQT